MIYNQNKKIYAKLKKSILFIEFFIVLKIIMRKYNKELINISTNFFYIKMNIGILKMQLLLLINKR